MAWKDNTAHIPIRRRYRCDVCEFVFDMRHERADEPMPDCPRCVEAGKEAAQMAYVPPMPAIGTTKSKAIDLAQKVAEEDYGLTDMNDNQRAGDIAFKPPAPMQTAQMEKELREILQYEQQTATNLLNNGAQVAPTETGQILVDNQAKVANYWQGNAGGSAETSVATQQVGREASAQAKRDGVDPVGLLEAGRASGSMPMRLNVMGAVASSELPQELQAAQAARGT